MDDIAPVVKAAARLKVCAQCGAAFGCSTGGGCWCAAELYRLPMPSPGSGTDCMCPTCLRAAAARLAL